MVDSARLPRVTGWRMRCFHCCWKWRKWYLGVRGGLLAPLRARRRLVVLPRRLGKRLLLLDLPCLHLWLIPFLRSTIHLVRLHGGAFMWWAVKGTLWLR